MSRLDRPIRVTRAWAWRVCPKKTGALNSHASQVRGDQGLLAERVMHGVGEPEMREIIHARLFDVDEVTHLIDVTVGVGLAKPDANG
jgi:hypothetical protein